MKLAQIEGYCDVCGRTVVWAFDPQDAFDALGEHMRERHPPKLYDWAAEGGLL